MEDLIEPLKVQNRTNHINDIDIGLIQWKFIRKLSRIVGQYCEYLLLVSSAIWHKSTNSVKYRILATFHIQ